MLKQKSTLLSFSNHDKDGMAVTIEVHSERLNQKRNKTIIESADASRLPSMAKLIFTSNNSTIRSNHE